MTAPFGPFTIDVLCSDDEILYVDVPSQALTVTIKLDHDGIVVDVFPARCAIQPAATLAVTYDDVQAAAETNLHFFSDDQARDEEADLNDE